MNFTEMIQKGLSESGEISFGRLASFMSLLFCLGWDTAYLVFVMMHYQQLHISAADILPAVAALAGQTAFCSSWYTINKVRSAFQGTTPDSTTPPSTTGTPTS